jgi:molybdopterin/thiamine biosynthesis adenylyltransferase
LSRIDRQLNAAQFGWKQDKLKESHVVVVGSTNLAQLLVLDFMAMEFGNVTWSGRPSLPYFSLDTFNPVVKHNFINGDISRSDGLLSEIIGIPTHIIGATDSIIQNRRLISYSQRNSIPITIASASNTGFAYNLLSNTDDVDNVLAIHENFACETWGTSNSVITSALVSDNVRKSITPMVDELVRNSYQIKTTEYISNSNSKILIVGAGGTGNFAALSLAMQNKSCHIMDDDVVEESNLARQVLLSGAIGQSKAKVVASRLGKSWVGIHGKFAESFKDKYDIVLCCVDNDIARYHINNYCMSRDIPLLNCGVSLNNGAVHAVKKTLTGCLDCQISGVLSRTYMAGETRREAVVHSPR